MTPLNIVQQIQGYGVGVEVPRSSGFGPESESLIWRRLRALSISSGLLCNFAAVYLTFVQLILQLKLCLFTILHLLSKELKNFSQVILKYTIIMSHNKSESRSLILGPESELELVSYKKQGLRIPEQIILSVPLNVASALFECCFCLVLFLINSLMSRVDYIGCSPAFECTSNIHTSYFSVLQYNQ